MSLWRRGGPPLRYTPRDARDAVDGAEPVTRDLRALYAAPEDPRYWDGLEARIVAAVRGGAAATTGAMRAVPTVAVEWWHALARWARPALAAAAVTLVVAGAVLVGHQAPADASRASSAFRAVLGEPGDAPGANAADALPEPDPQLARATDLFDADPGDSAAAADARAARIAAELLGGGLVRRRALPPAVPSGDAGPTDVRAAPPARTGQRGGALHHAVPDR